MSSIKLSQAEQDGAEFTGFHILPAVAIKVRHNHDNHTLSLRWFTLAGTFIGETPVLPKGELYASEIPKIV